MLIRLSHTKAQYKNIIGIKGHTSVETYYNRPAHAHPNLLGRNAVFKKIVSAKFLHQGSPYSNIF